MEPNQWILEHAELLGVNPSNVNPASVDLCLGSIIERTYYGDSDSFMFNSDDEVVLQPGVQYLCSTEETTYCPDTHAWLVTLKSTPARNGIYMSHTGLGDPGFKGQVTVSLATHRPIKLKRGQRLLQLMYFPLTKPTELSYGQADSHYQGQQGATVGWNEGIRSDSTES